MPRSGHIAELRGQVGSRRLLVPSVSVLIHDGAGHLLLLRHHDGGRWGTPGGAVEPDERPADAAMREAWEETGLLVEPTRIVGVFGGPRHELTYDNGDVTAYVTTAFAARIVGGELRPGADEISEARWIGGGEWDDHLVDPYTAEILAVGFSQLARDTATAWFAPGSWTPPTGEVADA